jgi:hypothetical protein
MLAFLIIDDLDFACISVSPEEANSPLAVYPDAVLSGPLPDKFLQVIRRGRADILQCCSSVKHPEFAPGRPLNTFRQHLRGDTMKNLPAFFTVK